MAGKLGRNFVFLLHVVIASGKIILVIDLNLLR